MPKIVVWNAEEAEEQLKRRLQEAREGRRKYEATWRANERTVFPDLYGELGPAASQQAMILGDGEDVSPEAASSDASMEINYVFKNWRYVHAQLSANPPSVIPCAVSNDMSDRRAADAADRLLRFGRVEYDFQEKFDQWTSKVLLYGYAVAKTYWDQHAGELLDVDEETGEVVMDGDFKFNDINIWNFFPDPDAENEETMNYAFERILVPYDEAVFRWPEQAQLLRANRIQAGELPSSYGDAADHGTINSSFQKRKWDVVELYEYWEKGLPSNGMQGRFYICTRDGQILNMDDCMNPERYVPPRSTSKSPKKIPVGVLPYHVLTDIDVPDTLYGKSFVEYASVIQDKLNRIDSMTLDGAQAHGIPRLILPETADVAADSVTNSPWDVIKITGSQPLHYMQPMPLPEAMPLLMNRYKAGVDDMAGVNESMFGQQSREQSGFLMQNAVSQGNMIRYRLFNKYRRAVKNVYTRFLMIVQKHWKVARTIRTLGKEKAFESMDIMGADIAGGYDLYVEYGASLSLDPTARRDEMLSMMPLFKEAGIEPRQILKMLKLNELSSAYDLLDLAADRQREIFDEMVATNRYISPEKLQDHTNMLAYCSMYLMTSDFKYLPIESKVLLRRHVVERQALLAEESGSSSSAPPDAAPPALPAMPDLGGATPLAI